MTADRARGALAVLQDADGKFICEVPCGYIVEQSLPARGAWVEILLWQS